MRTVVLLISTCALAAAAFGDVVGEYQGSGTNPDGGSYECDVTVSRKGDA